MYHVIIIEDDPMVASINQNYLLSNPLFVLDGIFRNGQEALDYLSGHTVDLAIIDYFMPMMDGKIFIQNCIQRNYSFSFIMITAANNPQDFSDILRLGALDYIVKPFTYDRFTLSIQKFLTVQTKLHSAKEMTQEMIDEIISSQTLPQTSVPSTKGIQPYTLDAIINYLSDKPGVFYSCDEIAGSVKLSRITIKRYLNHLLDSHVIISKIDYNTGGRPSIRYALVKPRT